MSDAKERQSLVWGAMDKLQASIMSLEDNVTMMENRLDTALSPPSPTLKEEDSEVPQESALTSSINNNIGRIRSASNRLNDLLDRIEI